MKQWIILDGSSTHTAIYGKATKRETARRYSSSPDTETRVASKAQQGRSNRTPAVETFPANLTPKTQPARKFNSLPSPSRNYNERLRALEAGLQQLKSGFEEGFQQMKSGFERVATEVLNSSRKIPLSPSPVRSPDRSPNRMCYECGKVGGAFQT